MSRKNNRTPRFVFPLWAATVGLLAGSLACQVNVPVSEPPPPSDGTVSFATQVEPILVNSCSGCHSPGGAAFVDNGIPMNLTEGQAYDAIVNQLSVQNASWTIVVPGDSASSLLYLKVSMDTPPVGVRMPRFTPPLSGTEQGLIRDWIDQGALNN
jgi:hypothetical protein